MAVSSSVTVDDTPEAGAVVEVRGARLLETHRPDAVGRVRVFALALDIVVDRAFHRTLDVVGAIERFDDVQLDAGRTIQADGDPRGLDAFGIRQDRRRARLHEE